MVAASHGTEPDSPFRNHRARQHAQRKRTRNSLAQFPSSPRLYARAVRVERVAFPKAIHLGSGEGMSQIKKATELAVVVIAILIGASRGFAQVGTTAPAPPEGARANQLPLSGRSSQTGAGAVRTTQLPVAGATTSVNTINPSVQVQGPY